MPRFLYGLAERTALTYVGAFLGLLGREGDRGEQGLPGPSCPDGYSLQAPSWDPDALVCRRDGAPQPEEPTPTPTTPAALAPDRRRL